MESVRGMTHDVAIGKLRDWGFTNHPRCHDRAGHVLPHNSDGTIHVDYKDAYVVDQSPLPGRRDCGSEEPSSRSWPRGFPTSRSRRSARAEDPIEVMQAN